MKVITLELAQQGKPHKNKEYINTNIRLIHNLNIYLVCCLLSIFTTKFFYLLYAVEMDPAAPGPHDPSVLTMQADHRSSVLWDVQVKYTLVSYI